MPTPRKLTEQLKAEGTFRADRHAERDAGPKPAGLPRKPAGLKGHALTMWNRLFSGLAAQAYAEVDTEVMFVCCDLYARLREAAKLAAANPDDRFIAQQYRGYVDSWLRSMAELGATPLARQKIKATNPKKVEDPDDKFFGVVG